MVEKKHLKFIQILCLSVLVACQAESATQQLPKDSGPNNSSEANALVVPAVTPEIATPEPAASTPAPVAKSTAYQDAVNLASGAIILGNQATSLDDWSLIVGRWEQAIEKLEQVTLEDADYTLAQTKLENYGQNLAQAQQRLAILQQPPSEIPVAQNSALAATPSPSTLATVSGNTVVPIIERRGGTPVIEVTFNGNPYPMILDTGASHTHLPRTMANELGIQVLGQTSVATASSSQALVDVGYVTSIQVGGIQRSNLPVSIGDAVPIGLLGNDVYKNYDVILQANSVEFRPR
ncbi:MAG: retropepsin-like aspartic protease [Cyanobacteria bacterium P01_D01_bin.156]